MTLPDWPINPVPAVFPGFDPIRAPIGNVQVVVGDSSFSVPGPPAGKLRVFGAILLSATGAGNPSVTVSLQPGSFFLGRALAPIVASQSIGLPALSLSASLIIGEGESVQFVVTGANECTLFWSFYDISAVGRSLVRVQLSNQTAINIIPSAPPGFVRRWLFPHAGLGCFPGQSAAFALMNDDTVGTRVILRYGGTDFIARSSNGAANGGINLLAVDVVVTPAAALTAELAAAVTTRPVTVVGCFEAVPFP